MATFNKEQLDTALAEVVTAHVHHQLHVGVAVAGRLTAGTHRLHFNAGFLVLSAKGRQKNACLYTSVLDRYRFDADLDQDPDSHQNDAEPHVNPTQNFTHVGK